MSEADHSLKSALKKRLSPELRNRLRRSMEDARLGTLRLLARGLRRVAGSREDAVDAIFEGAPLTPDLAIRAYSQGMIWTGNPHGPTWEHPPLRAVVPVDAYHLGHKLRQYVRQERFQITLNQAMPEVLNGCLEAHADSEYTWITPEAYRVYLELHEMRLTHSVEAWQDGKLVGGVVGFGMGRYFSSESLFYRVTHASKVAFAHLCAALKQNGYLLHDVQLLAPINQQFGSHEIPRAEFLAQLALAIAQPSPGLTLPSVEEVAALGTVSNKAEPA